MSTDTELAIITLKKIIQQYSLINVGYGKNPVSKSMLITKLCSQRTILFSSTWSRWIEDLNYRRQLFAAFMLINTAWA
jgi:predicted branched-subunit amino acid permease